MIELLSSPEAWIAFATLTALELVLGIDNIIFISILVDRLPVAQREQARRLGLFMAMFMRIGLLLVLSWIVGLTAPIVTIAGNEMPEHFAVCFDMAIHIHGHEAGQLQEARIDIAHEAGVWQWHFDDAVFTEPFRAAAFGNAVDFRRAFPGVDRATHQDHGRRS